MHMEEVRESSDHSSALPNLQHDIVFDIFSRLPVKPLFRSRSVSKPFLSLIQDPLFVNFHLTKTFTQNRKEQIFVYYESPDYTQSIQLHFLICNLDTTAKTLVQDNKIKFPFKSKNGYLRIVGSSNGLVCFFDTNYFLYMGVLFLWNPVLGKFKVLPDPHFAHRIAATFSHVVVGFAFVSESVDFKVVLILYNSDTDSDSDPNVLVYTLGENSWRKIDALVPCYMSNSWSENVFINGSIHWMAFKGSNMRKIQDRIMLFNMRNEVFGEFGLPSNIDPNYCQPKLSTSCRDDSLSLFTHCNYQWEVWSMREYGVVESWVKQYTIFESRGCLPLRFMDNGDILAVMSSGNMAFYDLEKQECVETVICGIPTSFCLVGYTESLGLLNKGDQVFKV